MKRGQTNQNNHLISFDVNFDAELCDEIFMFSPMYLCWDIGLMLKIVLETPLPLDDLTLQDMYEFDFIDVGQS